MPQSMLPVSNPTIDTDILEDAYSSPASLNEECIDKRSLKEKILFFENVNTISVSSTEPSSVVLEDQSGMKKFSRHENNACENDLEEQGFASTDNEMNLDSNYIHSPLHVPISSPLHVPISSSLMKDNIKSTVTSPLSSPIKNITNNNSSNTTLALKSSQIIQDFSKFPSRPDFLKITPSFTNIPSKINSCNLYSKNTLIFSNMHEPQIIFRSPGNILEGRPSASVYNSIITESGIMHYIKVSSNSIDWFILKNTSRIPVENRLFNQFILSDIVEIIHKRSNFLLYNGIITIGKFIGYLLCLCIKENNSVIRCIKTLNIEKVEKKGNTEICIEGDFIGFSCEIERDEWINAINEQLRRQ